MTLRASRKYRGDVSLQDSVGTDGEGNDITYMDILGTEPDEVENTVIRQVTLSRVHEVLSSLPARERLVLEMRYGMLDGKQHPQHEVAKVLGISRSYVSRRRYCKRCLLCELCKALGARNDLRASRKRTASNVQPLVCRKSAFGTFSSYALGHWSFGQHREKLGAGYARQMQAFAVASRRKRLPPPGRSLA